MKILNRCGRFLSGVVYHNIAVLIAVGILRILFSPAGWFPNEHVYDLVQPVMTYLIPVLFAYTGGSMIGDSRGGLMAAFVMIGAIFGSNSTSPLILFSLMIGPLIGYLILKLEKWMEHYIPTGFEMLVQNAVSAVAGVFFSLLSYVYLATIMEYLSELVLMEMQNLIRSGLLPLLALVIEPGKVLFFNNVMNHGILEPLGMSQLKHADTSIFFMLESNPGPGFGLLLALFVWNAKKEKRELKATMTIQFLGGIHEVYFPYVLMKPLLLIPLVMGGITANFIFYTFRAGLVANPSPGSIIVYLAMSPGMHLPAVILGVSASVVVSFCMSLLLLRFYAKETKDITLRQHAKTSDTVTLQRRPVQKVAFACDGGMASSAMGAAKLKKVLKREGLEHIEVVYTSIDRIPEDADLVVAQEYLKDRIKQSAEHAKYLFVPSLMSSEVYEDIFRMIVPEPSLHRTTSSEISLQNQTRSVIQRDHIILDVQVRHQEAAIRHMAELLVDLQMVKATGITPILSGQTQPSIWFKHEFAILTDWVHHSEDIIQDGIVIVRFADAVTFDEGKQVHAIIAMCGSSESKLTLLPEVARIIEGAELRRCILTLDRDGIVESLNE